MEGVEEMTGTEDWRGANFTVSRSLIAERENSFFRCLFDAGALDSSAKATARSMTFTDRVLEEFFLTTSVISGLSSSILHPDCCLPTRLCSI
jgi:hypothetical protein